MNIIMLMYITFHNNLLLFIAILKLQTYEFEILKVAYYTLKKFLEPAESYLIMNNSIMNKNYISQLGEKICTFGQKIMIFKK